MANKDIWAVLVGVGYTAGDEPWLAPQQDVQNMFDYLMKRGTNTDCIKQLIDQEVTQDTIFDTIRTHLIDNDNIRRDDPILIYFSGYVMEDEITPTSKDKHWPIHTHDSLIQYRAFVTFNCMLPEDDPAYSPALPDAALMEMLSELHSKRGSNITLIMESNFNQSEHDSHVMLLASEGDVSPESDLSGGIFTRALLAALAEGENVTYMQLQNRIRRHHRMLWKSHCDIIDDYTEKSVLSAGGVTPRLPGAQLPLCIGTPAHRSRLLWRAIGDQQLETLVVSRTQDDCLPIHEDASSIIEHLLEHGTFPEGLATHPDVNSLQTVCTLFYSYFFLAV
jgi:hypothetical protein